MKPVIFLAFANDLVDYTHYLRSLSVEQRGIKNALHNAETHHLCEIIVQNNATIDDIFQIFQDNRYQNRIAVFHYGGHADGYQFLLNNAEGNNQIAHAGGLVGFLAQQKGLQLVFLNGCSTQQQSLELSQKGIPAVIGTSNNINDEIAKNLAVYFYEALGKGIGLERAWNEALWRIKTQYPDQKVLFRRNQAEQDRFPWDLYIAEGKEKVKEWNLPETAENPLFGLPEIPKHYVFPHNPFRFLEYYKPEHAQVFFGRSYAIRELYDKITNPQSASVILFYGQSGAGKSSLLEAGLLPRLEQDFQVVYLRRNREGLVRTLQNALFVAQNDTENTEWIQEIEKILGSVKEIPKKQISSILNQYKNPNPSLSLVEAWIEKEKIKPLILILDQAEELFTQKQNNQAELEEFLGILEQIFVKNKDRIKGKMILSYRKEYQAEFEESFKNRFLPKEKVFLQRLSRKDILEIFRALRERRLKEHYRIEIEANLDILIADDLSQDLDSPVAPVLQILLSKLWKEAEKNKNQAEQLVFDEKLYQNLHKNGILLNDFFEQQMAQIRQEFEFLDKMGVSLDFLNFHTTELGTAGSRNLDELRAIYNQQSQSFEQLQALKEKLTNLYLLTSPQAQLTTLAHDSLAPIVKEAFRKSEKTIPRALRILENKVSESTYNPQNVLEEDELVLVEKIGEIRVLNEKEEKLIERSRKRKAELEKERKRNKLIKQGLTALVGLFAVLSSIAGFIVYQQYGITKIAVQAWIEEYYNPTYSLFLAENAYSASKQESLLKALNNVLSKHQFYQQDFEGHTSRVKSVVFVDDSTIVSGSEDSTVRFWNLEGKNLKILKHSNFVRTVFLQNDTLLSTTKDSTYFWDKKGILLKKIQGETIAKKDSLPFKMENTNDWAFPRNKKMYVVAFPYPERNAKLYDKEGNLLKTFEAHTDEVSAVAFSPNGKYLVTGSYDKSLKLWNMQGREDWKTNFENRPTDLVLANETTWASINKNLYKIDNQGIIKDSLLVDSENAVLLRTPKTLWVASDTVLKLVDFQNKKIQKIISLKNFTRKMALGTDKIALEQDSLIVILDMQGTILKTFQAHQSTILDLAFSPNGNELLSAGSDSTAIVWDTKTWEKRHIFKQNEIFSSGIFLDNKTIILGDWSGRLQKINLKTKETTPFQIAKNFVNQIVLMPNGKEILVASEDKNTYLCNLNGEILQTFAGHSDSVIKIAVSADGTYFVSLSSDNSLMKWSLDPLVYLNSGRVFSKFAGK